MANPKVNSKGQEELDNVQKQFDQFDDQVKSLSLDEMNKAPMHEEEQQTRVSNRELQKKDAPYLKPNRSINSREKFNEKYRAEYEEKKKYVKCIVENLEIIGERVELWSKPFAGMAAEFWQVPVNTPIYIPVYLAEQISSRTYHRLVMDEGKTTGTDGSGTFYGAMAVKDVKRRIDCRPVGNGFLSMAG